MFDDIAYTPRMKLTCVLTFIETAMPSLRFSIEKSDQFHVPSMPRTLAVLLGRLEKVRRPIMLTPGEQSSSITFVILFRVN